MDGHDDEDDGGCVRHHGPITWTIPAKDIAGIVVGMKMQQQGW